ncbi:unnamed protein product [Rotaria sp. Silwood2]|nr:unnamed protein product [Rotaria sp. Silwood2]CAF3058690.1 unnamed protein product [Rotaria sp. Silwood2]CAF3346727.1 unnamed protein product [Rotaria sp. Silwood2]CAF3420573.1 unnamed protein product [Rotaria sp. Silwood2]CAF4206974.1 unnamed protein product [Rotaria sp. Silwood2]
MFLSFTRGFASGIIAAIIVILVILNESSYPLFFMSRFTNTNRSQSSNMHRMVNISYDNNQFFVFDDESPLVRTYLDVVRDTVCGLTLRTRESSVNFYNQTLPLDINQRIKGLDWPLIGITMVGQKRLINIEWALRFVIANKIPGDFIECGVWRGGSSIFARAVLKALNNNDKHVWLADSFQGLPKARTKNDNDIWSIMEYLKVSLEEVQTNFRSFNLLDDHVHFCKGYFVDSLPSCNISEIAVLRMDGDMYESTMDQLFNLYSKLQIGGVIIIDDYAIQECSRAIHDFRSWHNITDEIQSIPDDQTGRYWINRQKIKIQRNRYISLLSSTIKPNQ